MRLWDAKGVTLDDAVLSFTVGDDPILDRELLPYDCQGSAAHAVMLAEIGVLNAEERDALIGALREAYAKATAGEFEISQEQEDGHTALEIFLTEKTGDAGKKIHTGRSRNDQVIVASRLMVRDRLLALADQSATLVRSLLERTREHRETLMVGYTHTRQAMPSTVGQFLASAAEALIRDLQGYGLPLSQANRNPLGSASGYGVPLPLDRAVTCEALGFEAPDLNTIYVQNTRGKLEAAALFALHQQAITLGRFATDLIWWSSEAFGYFSLPLELTTGSSIMPQKRNPDVLELVRAVPASMLGRYNEVSALLQGLTGGYHRDLQRTKGPLLNGLNEARSALTVMDHAARKLKVHPQKCLEAFTDGALATDKVYAGVREGKAFREAYLEVKEAGTDGLDVQAELGGVLSARTHLGAPGTDQAESLRTVLEEVLATLVPFRDGAQKAKDLVA